MKAIIETTDDMGGAEYIRDENGGLWHVVMDAADGTLAVEEVTDGERRETVGRAGVFAWSSTSDGGDVWPNEEGRTYGVNSTDEFIVRRGEWVENVMVARE